HVSAERAAERPAVTGRPGGGQGLEGGDVCGNMARGGTCAPHATMTLGVHGETPDRGRRTRRDRQCEPRGTTAGRRAAQERCVAAEGRWHWCHHAGTVAGRTGRS